MKTYLTTLAAIVAAILIADPAHATGNHTPKEPPSKPKPTPAPPAAPPVYVGGSLSASSAANAGSTSAANSGATAGASSNIGPISAGGGTSSAAGGTGGTASTGDSNAQSGPSNATAGGASLTSQGGDTRALAIGLPPLASLPPMAAVQCGNAQIAQSSTGILMGVYSRAEATTDSSDCTLIGMYNSMVERCLFSSAKMVQDLLVKKHLPKFQAEAVAYLKDTRDPGFVDYSPTQCAEMRKPPAPVAVVPPPAPVPQPPAPPPAPAPTKVSLDAKALFDFDKAILKPGGATLIADLAAKLKDEIGANIVITGHTSSEGSSAYNFALSERRANAVKAELARLGIDLVRMVAIGKGKTEPVADNATEAGRQLNRRVDVQITVAAASPKLAALVR